MFSSTDKGVKIEKIVGQSKVLSYFYNSNTFLKVRQLNTSFYRVC
jgi:hypothetical protein